MKWKNITVRLGDLKPWADNPRMSTKKQAERILASFKKFGQVYPIAIGPKMEVYDGHQRLSALLTIHDENYQIEARKLERCLTDKELREFVILMNGTAMGQFDWDSLANWDAKELIDFGMDEDILHQFNNDAANLRELLNANIEPVDQEQVYQGMPEFISKAIEENAFICIVRFEKEEEIKEIQKKLGVKINHKGKTYSAWYPEKNFNQVGKGMQFTHES